MTAQDFISFRDFVLSKNTYLQTGYALAFKEGTTNTIFERSGTDFKAVFPRDDKANYFYLRVDSPVSFTPNINKRSTDSGPGRIGFDDSLQVQLVAIVRDADEWTVLNNLRNTAMQYTGMDMIPTAGLTIRELVVLQELAGVEDDTMLKALANLKNQTIVRLTLTIRKEYIPSSCINTPCKNC